MSRLTTALERLDLAVEHLDATLAAHEVRRAAENKRQADELRKLRTNHASLADEARTVSQRLDAAIGRLKTVMGT